MFGVWTEEMAMGTGVDKSAKKAELLGPGDQLEEGEKKQGLCDSRVVIWMVPFPRQGTQKDKSELGDNEFDFSAFEWGDSKASSSEKTPGLERGLGVSVSM